MSSGKILNSTYIGINENSGFNYPQWEIGFQIIPDSEKFNRNLSFDYKENLQNDINKFLHKTIEIHGILINNKDLSNQQKLDFCKVERYFMKQYLKEVVGKFMNSELNSYSSNSSEL